MHTPLSLSLSLVKLVDRITQVFTKLTTGVIVGNSRAKRCRDGGEGEVWDDGGTLKMVEIGAKSESDRY